MLPPCLVNVCSTQQDQQLVAQVVQLRPTQGLSASPSSTAKTANVGARVVESLAAVSLQTAHVLLVADAMCRWVQMCSEHPFQEAEDWRNADKHTGGAGTEQTLASHSGRCETQWGSHFCHWMIQADVWSPGSDSIDLTGIAPQDQCAAVQNFASVQVALSFASEYLKAAVGKCPPTSTAACAFEAVPRAASTPQRTPEQGCGKKDLYKVP